MGLIAREVEARGIPTVSLTSALSITASVDPPRAVHVDYPLGRTAGKPGDEASQNEIIAAALAQLADARTPGTIQRLDLRWAETDDWKDGVMRPKPAASASAASEVEVEDDRSERTDVPQYQFEADRDAVEPNCPTCIVPGQDRV